MKKTIVLSSITYALKARDILAGHGIRAEIVRSRAVKSVRGCGYGLSLDPALLSAAQALLASEGVPVLGSVDEK
ncbi:MAG: DUF3343 domain-containing protein [Clostridia bacterium]|nr:DUF3343 domain-containing protein [Clostridia bacterium]